MDIIDERLIIGLPFSWVGKLAAQVGQVVGFKGGAAVAKLPGVGGKGFEAYEVGEGGGGGFVEGADLAVAVEKGGHELAAQGQGEVLHFEEGAGYVGGVPVEHGFVEVYDGD